MSDDLSKSITAPKWALMLALSLGVLGPASLGVSVATKPDLELLRKQAATDAIEAAKEARSEERPGLVREAVDIAVERARVEREREDKADREWLEERFMRLEEKIDAIADKGGR